MKKQEKRSNLRPVSNSRSQLLETGLQGLKSTKAFTLVELIVVITILAILGTIAFISLQGYSKDARDSVRISDISKIKTSLELFQLDAGKYPETTEPTNITYSGAIAWTQGTFGTLTFNNVTKLDKIPLDPVTDRQYVYSVTNTKQEYQIAGIMEGDEVSIYSPLPLGEGLGVRANAAQKTAMLKISGNYNGKVLKVSTGTIDYVLAVPSIITSSGFTLDQIISSKFLAYNGYKNLPAQYAGSSYEVLGDDEINLVNSDDLVIYSGDLKTLSSTELAGTTARKNLIEKLKSAYSGTAIIGIGEIAQIINTDTEDSSATEFLSTTIVSNNLGGSITVSIPRVNACATQPEFTGATYEIGVATEPDQAWQSSNASAPCYWTCGVGKVLDENTCISETCSGTTPDGTAKVSNATSFAGGTWAYNTTPGKCTYICGETYHTEDGGTSCISNTKSCTITHGIGEQTWNGTSRGACIATSCTDGYTGTNCEIAPALITSTNCTDANWEWVDNTTDTIGNGFCISPRVTGGTEYISWMDIGTAYSWTRTNSSPMTAANAYANNQYGVTYDLGAYSCKTLGTSTSGFTKLDNSDSVLSSDDTIENRMRYLAKYKTDSTKIDDVSIDWVTVPSIPNGFSVPALYLSDCIDGTRDLNTGKTYDGVDYSTYSNTTTNTDASRILRNRYLLGWTKQVGSHLPSAYSDISSEITNMLTVNKGEYQIACEAGKFGAVSGTAGNLTGSEDDTANMRIRLSAVGGIGGTGWGSDPRIVGYIGCGDQYNSSAGYRTSTISARFVVRP